MTPEQLANLAHLRRARDLMDREYADPLDVAALRAEDIPAEASRTAGGFLCNRVFYVLMGLLEDRPGTTGGFVHVPEDMPIGLLVRAGEIVVACAAAPALS